MEFGCGGCKACLVNRKRIWTSRILLEALSHQHNAFVTLTYKEAPEELVPLDLKNFLRRLRDSYPVPFRYYAVGEYGSQGLRPHFHAALFGVSWLDREQIAKVWAEGFVHTGELNKHSAGYIAGYVCKKITTRTDPRLEGKHPEFARMSLKPGIGALQCEKMGENLIGAFENGHVALDVPSEIRWSGRKMPMGKYVQGKLREAVGWERNMPQDAKNSLRAELEGMDRVVRHTKRESAYRALSGRLKISDSRRKL